MLPNAVETDSKGFKAVNYNSIVPYAVGAVQEQEELILSNQDVVGAIQRDLFEIESDLKYIIDDMTEMVSARRIL